MHDAVRAGAVALLILSLAFAAWAGKVLPRRPAAGGGSCDNTLSGETYFDEGVSGFVSYTSANESLRWLNGSGSSTSDGTAGSPKYGFYWPSATGTDDQWACVRPNIYDNANSGAFGVLFRVNPFYTEDNSVAISSTDYGGTKVWVENCTGSDTAWECDIDWEEGLGSATQYANSTDAITDLQEDEVVCFELTGSGASQKVRWWVMTFAVADDRCDDWDTNASESGTLTPTGTPTNNTGRFVGIAMQGSTVPGIALNWFAFGDGQSDDASGQGSGTAANLRDTWTTELGASNLMFAEDWDNGPNDNLMVTGSCNEEMASWGADTADVDCVTDPRTNESDQVLRIFGTGALIQNANYFNSGTQGTASCMMLELRWNDGTWGGTEDLIRITSGGTGYSPERRFDTGGDGRINLQEIGNVETDIIEDDTNDFILWMYQDDYDATEDETDNHQDLGMFWQHRDDNMQTKFDLVGSGNADPATVDGIRILDGADDDVWVDNWLFFKSQGCPWGQP